MLSLLFLQATLPPEEFCPPRLIKSPAALKRSLEGAYLGSEVVELSSGDCRVTYAYGRRTSGITVVDIFVYIRYEPRGVKTGSQILAASLHGRSGIPQPRIVKMKGDYALHLGYATPSKRKITEVISLSLFNPVYRPY